MKRDNYEIMREQMRLRFLTYPQDEMIRKFSLRADDEFLYIRFCAKPYRVRRTDGLVEGSDDGFQTCTEGNFRECMSIYDVLCDSKPDCRLSGQFCPSSSLKGTVYSMHVTGSGPMFEADARVFSEHMERLPAACAALGGVPEGRGDVAYRLPLFDFLPMQFSFWQADDEFPAEIRLLWDANVLQFLHYETLWYAAMHLMQRLESLL